MFLVEIPADFAGVESVEVSPSGLTIRERRVANARQIPVSTCLAGGRDN